MNKKYFPPSLAVIEMNLHGIIATSGSTSESDNTSTENFVWKNGISNKYKNNDDEDDQY